MWPHECQNQPKIIDFGTTVGEVSSLSLTYQLCNSIQDSGILRLYSYFEDVYLSPSLCCGDSMIATLENLDDGTEYELTIESTQK